MPNVSVIVPNYNHARFLEKRLESIFNQTYQDFEVIFLDDASTDNSLDVFSKFADNPRIASILNAENSGSPFKQWNKGISLAQGEYIWIAESDDYAAPTLLEKLVQVLDTHKAVGLAYCQSWEVDENNTVLSNRQYWTDDLDPDRWQQDFVSNGPDECRNFLVHKNTIPNASAVLFRAEAYKNSQINNETFRLVGDWFAWAKILIGSDIAFISEPLNYYRTHAHTARKKNWQSLASMVERVTVVEYIKNTVDISPHKISQVSMSLSDRLLTVIKQEDNKSQYWSLIWRIANLNEQTQTRIKVHKRFLIQLVRQKMSYLKVSFRSQMLRFTA
jgi:glycosyltransferase involved in cell wall biosynthesis